jgi:hypothetical protein
MDPRRRAPPWLSGLAAAAALSGASGCSTFAMIQGGFATSTSLDSGRHGGALEMHFAQAIVEPFHIDLAVRGRLTRVDRQAALGMGALLVAEPEPVSPYGLAGFHFFQAGRTDMAFSYGAGTPFAEAGVILRPGGELAVSLGTSIEYTLRFSPQPHEAFWAVKLGLPWWWDRP